MATESEFAKTISGYYRDNEFALRHTAEMGWPEQGLAGPFVAPGHGDPSDCLYGHAVTAETSQY
jgi:hypothetical protein